MNRQFFVRRLALFMLVCTSLAIADDRRPRVVAPERVGLSAEKLSAVDTAMKQLIADSKLPGGVVLVARHGQVAYLKSFGKKDVAGDQPMTIDTIFRIYSMSKAITSAAAMILVDEGKLALDDPIAKYIPEFKDVQVYKDSGNVAPTRPPTVRDLLRHTAGLTYGVFGNSAVDQQYRAAGVLSPESTLTEMGATVGGLPLEYQPGKGWKYSVASDVLGRVVEVASGKTLAEFFQTRIFEPLGMVDSGFFVPAEKLDRFATNYNRSGQILTPIDVPVSSTYRTPAKLASGGGGLVSTIADYYRFLQMVANGGTYGAQGEKRLLSEQSVQLMTTNQLPEEAGWVRFGPQIRRGVGFGLGFSVRAEMSAWDPDGRVGEYGWGGAASTHYWVSPKDDLIVITMEQVMPYSFSTEFAVKKLIYDAIVAP
ncbi:MAG: beta-lactamase family protein [Planctomycetaceae bacterium]|nr:beta-lactamase family protein [Planctomycetaceae bacterium]